jgi:hypothetical protein
MNIVMLQTADAKRYLPMLQATAAVNQAYCARHGVGYSQFIGIKRGFHPWQACFNRIMLIKEMIDVGFRGWVFYLDADAFVADLSFDVRQLISATTKPVIMAPGGLTGEPWDVNDGVFLIDLDNETARNLIFAWHSHFMRNSEDELRAAVEWESGVESDQPRLHGILHTDPRFHGCVGMVDRYLFNNEKGSFVRQILRSNARTWNERLARIRKETEDALLSETVIHDAIAVAGG